MVEDPINCSPPAPIGFRNPMADSEGGDREEVEQVRRN
jgi:hypothetical protein